MIKQIALLLLLSPLALYGQTQVDLPAPILEVKTTVWVETEVNSLYFFSAYKPIRGVFAKASEIMADSTAAAGLEQVLRVQQSACRPVQLSHAELGYDELFSAEPGLYFVCGFTYPDDQVMIARLGERAQAGGPVHEYVCWLSMDEYTPMPLTNATTSYELLIQLLTVLTPMAWEALYNPTAGLEQQYHQETLRANEQIHTPFPGRKIDLTRLASMLAHLPPDQLLAQVKRYHIDGSEKPSEAQEPDQK